MKDPTLKELPKSNFTRPLKCVIWHIYQTSIDNPQTVFRLKKIDQCGRDVRLSDVKRLNHYRAINLQKEMDDFYWIEIYRDNFEKLMEHDRELTAMRDKYREMREMEILINIGDSLLGMYKKIGMARTGYIRVAEYFRKINELDGKS
jgi:hypothetical protein